MTAFPLTSFGARWGTGLVTHVVMSEPKPVCRRARGAAPRREDAPTHSRLKYTGPQKAKSSAVFQENFCFSRFHRTFNICLVGPFQLFCWCFSFFFPRKDPFSLLNQNFLCENLTLLKKKQILCEVSGAEQSRYFISSSRNVKCLFSQELYTVSGFNSHLVICLYLVYCRGLASFSVSLQIIIVSMLHITKVYS